MNRRPVSADVMMLTVCFLGGIVWTVVIWLIVR